MIISSIYALLAAGSWGVADFVSLVPSRRIGYYLTACFLQLVGFVEVSVYVLFVNPSALSLASSFPKLFIVTIVVGILGFMSILFLLRGFSKGVMSVVSPISSTYPVITILLSVIFLSATLSGIEALGIAALLTGIVLAGIKISELRRPRTNFDLPSPSGGFSNPKPFAALQKTGSSESGSSNKWITKGVGSALGTSLCAGVLFFGLGFVTPSLGYILPVIVMKGAASLASIALLSPLKQKFQVPEMKLTLLLVGLGVLDAMGLIFFNLGIFTAGSSLPIVVTISSMGTVLTIILARTFYKEKLDLIQYLGIVVLLAGLSVVLYFSSIS